MKPPLFDSYDPTTEAEALAPLAAFGPEAKILAGGQSLMPLLNMHLVEPANLIDINRVATLAYIVGSTLLSPTL
jgi:CO/xanthine dehydrogenase FAD-binding subunit